MEAKIKAVPHHHLQKFPMDPILMDHQPHPSESEMVINIPAVAANQIKAFPANSVSPSVNDRGTTCNYRFDGTFQAEYFFLKQMQRPRFTAVAGESGGTGRVDAVDPSIQFRLTRSLQRNKVNHPPINFGLV